MVTPNGTVQEQHLIAERLEALKEGFGKLVDRIASKPPGPATRFQAFSTRATETIKAYPIVAVAAAAGLGYLIVRVLRR